MLYTNNCSDLRLRAWCIHCSTPIGSTESNLDHVPTKALLSKRVRADGAKFDRGSGGPFDYLPQVRICKSCNSRFSEDETYLLCLLHAVLAGTLYPDPQAQADAYNVLRSNRHIVRELRDGIDGQMWLFDNLEPFTLYPDPERISRVIVKNARGHMHHEIAENAEGTPDHVAFVPLHLLNPQERNMFESSGDGEIGVWPEVGSRMMERILTGDDMVGGWVIVEPERYRFSIDWRHDITVKTVIWEYLATETRWSR
ncbi:MAG: hypothetical protein AAFR21_05140 [Pseudomonadota bacterium]